MSQESKNDWEDISAELLKQLLSKATKQNLQERAFERTTDDELMRKVRALVDIPTDFKPGDTVRWKNGLKNRKLPSEEQLAVVVRQLSEPLVTDEDSGTPYFREPLDLVLAFIDKEDRLVVFYYDRRRFERVEQNGARFSEETIQRLCDEAQVTR